MSGNDAVYGLVQYGIIIVWPFMLFTNGKRGTWKGMKWLFLFLLCGTSGTDGSAADSALREYTNDCWIKVFMILCIKINSVLF